MYHNSYINYIINKSLVIFTNHLHRILFLLYCMVLVSCQIITKITSSDDLSWQREICANISVFKNLQVKKGFSRKTLLLPAYRWVSHIHHSFKDLYRYGFSCVILERMYSLNFFLVNRFHFECLESWLKFFFSCLV